MKKIFYIVLVIGLLFGSNFMKQAKANTFEKQAIEVAKSTSDEALTFLKDQKKKGWDEQAVRKEFAKILDRYFDLDYIAKASVGTYWRRAKSAERKDYLSIFKRVMVKVYSARFKGYSDQKIDISKASDRGRGNVVVFSEVVSNDGQPPVSLNWRIRKGKVVDLDVAGVSMLTTQRSEYQSIIEQNGGSIQALIDELKTIEGEY